MSDLDTLHAQLPALRKQLADAEREVVRARSALSVATRGKRVDATQQQAASSALASATSARVAAAEVLDGVLGRIAALGDPTKLIENLDDSYPIMLFPLRLETRFVQRGTSHELWIRIYPDDCQVQTFTDFITDAELTNTRRFWINWWKAGRNEAQQRAAWRGLVARHGSGRAQRLIAHYKPAGDPPTKLHPQDVLLVVMSDATPANLAAAKAYWVARWRAGKNAHARDAAYQQLVAAVGAAAADDVITNWAPRNLDDEPLAPFERAAVAVDVVTLALPPESSIVTSATSWQQAPRVTTLPECFIATGYKNDAVVFTHRGNRTPTTLAVGPDPSLPDAEQIKSANGELTLNADLRWLGDFEEAVAQGMGMKVPLTAQQYTDGFDRLVVLGVRLSSDAEHGAQLVESLFADHQASKSGMAILPQGTPTNNTDAVPSGYTWQDDPDASYDRLFGGATDFRLSSDPMAKRDGQWLAEALGIDIASVRHLPHADGLDQAQARAMNTALWPTTWGYFFEHMVGPQLAAADVEHLRTFFIRYISGRGTIPAIRIAKQPYGILPATVQSRLYLDPQTIPASEPAPHLPPGVAQPTRPAHPTQPGHPVQPTHATPVIARPALLPNISAHIAAGAGAGVGAHIDLGAVLHRITPWPLEFLVKLTSTLGTIRSDFDSLIAGVPHVGGPGDPQQVLLDLIAQQPSSVEFYQRYVQTFTQVLNQVLATDGSVAYLLAALVLGELQLEREHVLTKLGLDPAQVPMLEKILRDDAQQLTGGVIDDRPLSEISPIRPYAANGTNYLEWMVQSPFDAIRREDFGGKPKPRALLYLVARYALLLSYSDSALHMLDAVDPQAAAKARIEPMFLHTSSALDGASRYDLLAMPNAKITGDAHLPVAEYLDRPVARQTAAGARLQTVRDALAVLQHASTAGLERLFAEHIDLCSYRLDAWRLGLVHHRLAQQRERKQRGVYLGAFGWVENLRPDNKPLTPHATSRGLHASFTRSDRSPIFDDASNGGYIHAPSIPQATTAAILRNAYVSHATSADPSTMAVNLSSARVRAALEIVEGIQQGQGLAELLGYQLERGLHDAHLTHGVELDAIVFELRKRFPLVANQHADTRADAPLVDAAAARNVIDGYALIEHVQTTGHTTYPFGLTGPTGLPPASSPAVAQAITAEVERVRDTCDAVSDLMLAESVHQAVHGQTARATAAIDAIGKGCRPHEPEVIETPRSGMLVVHRVAIHLDPTATAPVRATPRVAVDPAIEAWLASLLPVATDIVVAVHYEDPAHGARDVVVSQHDLGLGAVDLLYLLDLDGQQASGELDDRIARFVRTIVAHPGGVISIRHLDPVPGKTTMFEVAALIAKLRTVLVHSRALAATDLVRASDVGSDGPRWNASELATRIGRARAQLAARLPALQALETDTTSTAEAYLAAIEPVFLDLALHGVSETGLGALRGRIHDRYVSATTKLATVVARWDEHRAEHVAILATLPSLADDVEKRKALQRAERAISADMTHPIPDVPDYLAVLTSKLAAFDAALATLRAPLSAPVSTLASLLDAIEPAIAAIPTFDAVWFDIDRRANDLAPERDALALLRDDLGERVTAIRERVETRLTDAQVLLDRAAADADAGDAVEALEQAAALVLGTGVKVLPRFSLATDPGDELASAYAARGELVQHLVDGGREFPVDDWLYGVARVRAKVEAWESAIGLTEAFGRPAPELTPLQLPYGAGDRWAALELAPSYKIEGEKLLYTASFATQFDHTTTQCGVVLDEWTEVVPGDQETTGIAFHFDQPNNEPPQAILLASPPVFRGGWRWEDLRDTVIETFAEAKLRAVEPEKVHGTEYGQFLPATLLVVTRSLITISANLFDNNG